MIVNALPASWKTDATVIRGGRDPYGNPLPAEEIPLEGVLAAPRSTAEPLDRTDLTEAMGVLYLDHGQFEFEPTDRIEFPDTAMLRGTWAVDGEMSRWPMGDEVPLRKV